MPRENRSWWIYQGHGHRNATNTLSPQLTQLGDPHGGVPKSLK